jgi:DNA-binding MarR family transcriptional regulator
MDRQAPRAPRLDDAAYGALGRFRRAMREFLAFSEQTAQDEGLRPQQHQALLAIRAHSGPADMSIGELAECLLIRHHTAVELVGRLVDRKLVFRIANPEDRRQVLLRLEPLGAAYLERISMRNLQQLAEAAESLSEVLKTFRHLEREGAGKPAARKRTGSQSPK